MRGTIGVTAELLQLLDAPRHQRFGNGSPHAGMILMEVHTLQLQWLTIQQESSVSIEVDGSDSDCRRIDIRHLTADPHRRFHLIQIRVCRTPQMRTVQRQLLLASRSLFGSQRDGRGSNPTHLLTVSIQQTLLHLTILGSKRMVIDLRLYIDDGRGVGSIQH